MENPKTEKDFSDGISALSENEVEERTGPLSRLPVFQFSLFRENHYFAVNFIKYAKHRLEFPSCHFPLCSDFSGTMTVCDMDKNIYWSIICT